MNILISNSQIQEGVIIAVEVICSVALCSILFALVSFSKHAGHSVRSLTYVYGFFLLTIVANRLFRLVLQWDDYSFNRDLAIKLSMTASAIAMAAMIRRSMPKLRALLSLQDSEAARMRLESEVEMRRAVEEKLLLYASALRSSSEGVNVCNDDDMVVIYANPRFEKMMGYSPGELLGKDANILRDVQSEISDPVVQIRQSLKIGQIWRGELQLRRKNGSTVWCKVGTVGMIAGGRRVWVNTVSDISRRKAAERKVLEQQAKITASAKMAALGEMAAGIGHEINNPLSAIRATAEDLRDLLYAGKLDPADLESRLRRIETTSDRISSIIRGLRNFAREQSGMPVRQVRLDDVLQDTLSLCSEKLSRHQVELRIENDCRDLEMECQPVQLTQVLLNLLNNAHDAVLGLPERWVEVKARAVEDQLEIRITDSGKGIPAEVQANMMHPFFSTKDPNKGSGLGLSISKGIAEQHQGKLTFNASHPNTQFILTMPLTQGDKASVLQP